MRTFLAVDICEEVRAAISSLLGGLKSIDPGVKWVDPGNMHITLLFLGDIDETTLQRIVDISLETVRGMRRFTVEVNGIGGFPSLSVPRVAWVRVKDDGGELGCIYGGLREMILAERLPFTVEKRGYTPHITIGRFKKRPDRKLLESIEARKEQQFGSCEVRGIVLYRSTLTRRGAVYDRLREFLF